MSGELRVRGQLDRERTEVYMLNITVYDQGVDPRQKAASRLLRLVIKDANDNPPSFIKSAFSFFFPENSQVGAAVVTLNATDPGMATNSFFSLFLFCKRSLDCLKDQLMTLNQGNTFLYCSSHQLPTL